VKIDAGDIRVLTTQYVDLVRLVEDDLGRPLARGGRLFRGCCPFHSERTESFVVYADQNTYHCYGCGAHGDAAAYVGRRMGLDFPDSLRVLARLTGYWPAGLTESDGKPAPAARPAAPPRRDVQPDKRVKWQPIIPVPAKVEALAGIKPGWQDFVGEARRRLPAVAVWAYRDAAGNLIAYDVRFEYLLPQDWYTDGHTIEEIATGTRHTVSASAAEPCSDVALVITTAGLVLGVNQVCRVRKAPVTYTWCQHAETGECKWYPKPPPKPYPLYGLDRAAARPDAELLFCEGAKAADAGQRKFPQVAAMSWRGGSSTVEDYDNNDWSAVHGRRVAIWPDADETGHKAAAFVAAHCHAAGATRVRIVKLPHGLPKGWDLADG
jgi:hypothetical protein